jgi:hypothetical protein
MVLAKKEKKGKQRWQKFEAMAAAIDNGEVSSSALVQTQSDKVQD